MSEIAFDVRRTKKLYRKAIGFSGGFVTDDSDDGEAIVVRGDNYGVRTSAGMEFNDHFRRIGIPGGTLRREGEIASELRDALMHVSIAHRHDVEGGF